MFLCPKNLPYSIEFLLDIYQEYAQQIQDYQWWIYLQDIEKFFSLIILKETSTKMYTPF